MDLFYYMGNVVGTIDYTKTGAFVKIESKTLEVKNKVSSSDILAAALWFVENYFVLPDVMEFDCLTERNKNHSFNQKLDFLSFLETRPLSTVK